MKQFSKRNVLAAVYPNLNVMKVIKREKKIPVCFLFIIENL